MAGAVAAAVAPGESDASVTVGLCVTATRPRSGIMRGMGTPHHQRPRQQREGILSPQIFDLETRVEAAQHGGEVETLRGFLGHQRDTLRWKCAGLAQDQLSQQLPPSSMSLGGLMKHLALVESQWFDDWFGGVDFAPPFDELDWENDGDWEFDSAREDSPAELRELFDEAVRRSDEVIDVRPPQRPCRPDQGVH